MCGWACRFNFIALLSHHCVEGDIFDKPRRVRRNDATEIKSEQRVGNHFVVDKSPIPQKYTRNGVFDPDVVDGRASEIEDLRGLSEDDTEDAREERKMLDLLSLADLTFYVTEMDLSTAVPSPTPSLKPSNTPTKKPSTRPSVLPSNTPSFDPSAIPSSTPSIKPSTEPSNVPTNSPSVRQSILPSSMPTLFPTSIPSSMPSSRPSSVPSSEPSTKPSILPSSEPSLKPSIAPSSEPSSVPSSIPTFSKCDMSQEERRIRITNILSTVSIPSVLNEVGTPQNIALEWLIEEDPFCSCPQDPKIVQRYVLAVFYLSAGGGTWDECNAPSNFTDPQAIAAANANCTIEANVTDPGNVPVFKGTDAWMSASYECYWGGVACRNSTFCLDQIELENHGLSGTLAFELQNLTEIRYLYVEEGNTTGTIPSEFGSLSDLLVLDLNFNQLYGTVPLEIYDIPFLLQLDLNNNNLTGTIATDIGQIEFLQFVQLEGNFFNGTIPTEVGNLAFLRVFEAFSNELTGFMPQEVCELRNRPPYNGSLFRLTVDCDVGDTYYVNCSVPECCTDCPF